MKNPIFETDKVMIHLGYVSMVENDKRFSPSRRIDSDNWEDVEVPILRVHTMGGRTVVLKDDDMERFKEAYREYHKPGFSVTINPAQWAISDGNIS